MMLNTSQLQAGDVVHTYGAQVLLTGQPATWTNQGNNLTVYTWQDMEIIEGSIWSAPHAKTWTIQGNRLATWSVTRKSLHNEN
jgi:23S rRNA maturation-related 3'-5' exoribonuclease YhaM